MYVSILFIFNVGSYEHLKSFTSLIIHQTLIEISPNEYIFNFKWFIIRVTTHGIYAHHNVSNLEYRTFSFSQRFKTPKRYESRIIDKGYDHVVLAKLERKKLNP